MGLAEYQAFKVACTLESHEHKPSCHHVDPKTHVNELIKNIYWYSKQNALTVAHAFRTPILIDVQQCHQEEIAHAWDDNILTILRPMTPPPCNLDIVQVWLDCQNLCSKDPRTPSVFLSSSSSSSSSWAKLLMATWLGYGFGKIFALIMSYSFPCESPITPHEKNWRYYYSYYYYEFWQICTYTVIDTDSGVPLLLVLLFDFDADVFIRLYLLLARGPIVVM